MCSPSFLPLTQTVVCQSTAPKWSRMRLPLQELGTSNGRRYHICSWISLPLPRPDKAASKVKGTRIRSENALPVCQPSVWPTLASSKANSQRPLSDFQSLRTICGRGYSGRTFSGVTSFAQRVISGAAAGIQAGSSAFAFVSIDIIISESRISRPHKNRLRFMYNSLGRKSDLPDHLPLDVQHLVDHQIVAEQVPVLEGPDHFFILVVGHLDQLRLGRPGVGIAEDDVAVGQNLQRRHPAEMDAGQFVPIYFPDDLALRVHLQHAVVVAARDERVAILEAHGSEDVDAMPVVAVHCGLSGQVQGVGPDDRALVVVLTHLAVALMANQIVPVVQFAHHARVAVGVGMVYR